MTCCKQIHCQHLGNLLAILGQQFHARENVPLRLRTRSKMIGPSNLNIFITEVRSLLNKTRSNQRSLIRPQYQSSRPGSCVRDLRHLTACSPLHLSDPMTLHTLKHRLFPQNVARNDLHPSYEEMQTERRHRL